MTTVQTICGWLDERFPADLAESWDNTGLLLGDPGAAVSTVMTCLTLTEDVAEEAAEGDVGLVVSQHPVLFRGAKSLTGETAEGRLIMRLIGAGVAVYSPHTRFDSAGEGINAMLAHRVGITDPRPLRPSDGERGDGGGRFGDLAEATPVEEFAAAVATATGVSGLHVVASGRSKVTRVAVACGAAGEYLSDAAASGCDGFVVGEARFHTALEARERGVAMFVPGHYGTERGAVESLAKTIGEQFDGVRSFASTVETDPLTWLPAD